MSTTRPFAYNTTYPIPGTIQVGNIAVGIPDAGFSSTGLDWWNGPDEDSHYIISYEVGSGNHPTSVPGINNIYLDANYVAQNISISNNSQTASQQFNGDGSVLGTILIAQTDKVMFSVKFTSSNPSFGNAVIGFGYTSMNYQGTSPYADNGFPGNNADGMGYGRDGNIYYNGGIYASGLQTWGDGDIVDILINNTQSSLWVRVNGGNWNNNPASDTSTGNGAHEIISGPFYPALCPVTFGTMEIQNISKYGTPSGYKFLGNSTASLGFWGDSTKTDAGFLALIKNKLGQTFSNTIAAKTWLDNNGYWTSFITPIGTSGQWYLGIGTFAYQPAWTNGIITLPIYSDSIGINDFNLILTTYLNSSGIYINQYDSMGNDQSALLLSLTTNSGTISFTQGSDNITFSFVPGSFVDNISSFGAVFYDPANQPISVVSTSNTPFIGYQYGDNIAPGTLTYNGSGIPPDNTELVTITIVI